jgi:hypothetical protein
MAAVIMPPSLLLLKLGSCVMNLLRSETDQKS